MKVTVEQLIEMGACWEHVGLAAAYWGDAPIEVNAQSCAEAAELGLDVDWVANKLLSGEQRDAYWAARKPIDDAYDAALKPIADAYWAACKPIYDAYYAACWRVIGEVVSRKPDPRGRVSR